MYIYIYIYLSAFTFVCIRLCTSIYISVCLYVCRYTRIYIYTYYMEEIQKSLKHPNHHPIRQKPTSKNHSNGFTIMKIKVIMAIIHNSHDHICTGDDKKMLHNQNDIPDTEKHNRKRNGTMTMVRIVTVMMIATEITATIIAVLIG